MPEFEHEERPEVGRVVAPPAVVLGVEKLDVSLIEVAARARARVEEDVAYVFAQFLIDPLLDGQAEALLGAVENLVGHEAAHGPFEDALRLKPTHLERRGDARHKLDELVV